MLFLFSAVRTAFILRTFKYTQKDSLQAYHLQAITIPFFPFVSGRQLTFPRPRRNLSLYILAIELYKTHTRSISPFRHSTDRSP